MHNIHGKWINETDFTDRSFTAVRQQARGDSSLEALVLKDVDRNDESKRQYRKFVDLYIQLYYEPLHEEYEEMKYFTRNHDKKMLELIQEKARNQQTQGLSEIRLKDGAFK